jgi:hypothetical protein
MAAGKQGLCDELAKLRTHTGRTTAITCMMGEGWPLCASMKQARHTNVKNHMCYGRMVMGDLARIDESVKKERARHSTKLDSVV